MSVDIDGKLYTWVAAICVADWNQRNPERLAAPALGDDRYVSGDVERCVYCGGGTTSGIYVRADPSEVPFPRLDVENAKPTEYGPLLAMSDALIEELCEPTPEAEPA